MEKNTARTLHVSAACLFAVASLGAFPINTFAATINVDTTSDGLNDSGNCSLREAIQAANTDGKSDACTIGNGADTIIVPAGVYTLSIAGGSENDNLTGDLDITESLTITGAGRDLTIIDAAGIDRAIDARCIAPARFEPCPIVTINISGVALINGSPASGKGGGLRVTADTANNSFESPNVTLADSLVSGNDAPGGGGGIGNEAVLTIRNSTIHDNSAGNSTGGGVDGSRTTTIEDSLISNNSARDGGGAFNSFSMTVNRSLFSGNSASEYGGGLSTIAAAELANNTFVSNSAGISGGGVTCGTPVNSCDINMSFSTLTGNIADADGDNAAVIAGGFAPSVFLIKANIFAGVAGAGMAGEFMSVGDNIIESPGSASGFSTTDMLEIDPQLAPLADNGGATQTRLPAASSPAIDATDCTETTSDPVIEDQRGFDRPSGSECDIGAVELESNLIFADSFSS